MDTNQIKRIAEAAKAVTPGDPWFYQEESDAYTHIVRVDNPELRNSLIITQQPQRTDGVSEARARHIAAANPDNVLAMVAEIDRLKAELECARGDFQTLERIAEKNWQDADRYRYVRARVQNISLLAEPVHETVSRGHDLWIDSRMELEAISAKFS